MRTEGRGGCEGRDNSVGCIMSGSTCRALRTNALTCTTVLITGERHWRSVPCSTHCSLIVSPARLMLVSGSSFNKIYADTITGKDHLSSCWPVNVVYVTGPSTGPDDYSACLPTLLTA